MFSTTHNNVTFFKDEHNENTERVVYGRVSEAVKTGKQDENGRDVYGYENWAARFVGAAREKAEKLDDKARITLTKWSARCQYNKDKKQSYPYLMVVDFEVRENVGAKSDEPAAPVDEDFELINSDNTDVPF